MTGFLAAALVAGIGASGAEAAVPAAAWKDVVVTGPGGAGDAARAVDQAGGDVVASLPIVEGVAARLPLGASLPARWSVTPQRTLTTAATDDGASGPTSTVRQTLGLPSDSREGAGITVAVMDTGVADVPDLAGRIADRVDITGGVGGDGHGHGTFMAGLIAGSGEASGGAYRGVAPEADIVDVKVADEHGSTDLITVLRGLQWVDDHRRDIQVLNLSLSSGSPLPYQIDPLTQALDALWRKGVVVVVPAGNTGPSAGSLTSPGNDPTLLTVAGLDEAGTADRADDSVAGWSGRGRDGALAQPDLAAPGASVVGLLAPGSVIATSYPAARVGEAYIRGSGSSMSTAVTSGIVAAVLSRRPALRPDAVTGLLTSTAYATPGLASAPAAGAGGLDAAQALANAKTYRPAPSRPDRDAALLAADARWWTALDEAVRSGDGAAATKAWYQLSVDSRAGASRAWADLDFTSRAWASRAWASGSWTSRAWAGAEGTDEQWVSRAWASRAWASRAWAGEGWASRAWAGEDWASRAWADADWQSRAWAADRWSSRAWAWLPPVR
ncbi:MAG: S8 family serine peptidase [Actinomycetota bacterium]|nr:S8 family serine peptidase [Actinomycetota bacterium]